VIYRGVLHKTLRKCVIMIEYVKSRGIEIRFHGRGKNEASHYCGQCEVRIDFFLQLFHKSTTFLVLLLARSIQQEKRHVVHCLDCARKQSPNLDGFVCLEEYKLEELTEVFDNFILHSQPVAMVRITF
jgi:lysine-specific demethylase 6A